jgi:uncharacterized phage-associated protein
MLRRSRYHRAGAAYTPGNNGSSVSLNPSQGFNIRKAAQVAAFFAKNSGGSINVLKLVKLMYLADREFMKRFDLPMLWDRLVSMPHGPVNSETYSFIDGQFTDAENWDAFISDRNNHNVGLANPATKDEDLDELSEADFEVLAATWATFGYMEPWQIRNYTHDHCPEWEDPDGSSNPIPYERVLKFLGKARSADTAEMIESQRQLSRVLARAR